jgi:hypothetical protein
MKKLLLSLCMMAVVAITSNAFGQDIQYPGSAHDFSVTDNSTGGFTYSWGVYSDAGLTSSVSSGFNLNNQTSAKATIEWTSITAGTYFVGVTETNPNGCSTSRYVEIEIKAATYDLVVTPVESDGSTLVTDLDECMSGSGQILSNSASLNTSGTNDRYFKVMLTNDGTNPWTDGNWKFDYTLTGTDGNATPTNTITSVEVVGTPSEVVGVASVAVSSATTITVSNLGAFVIKVTTEDNPGTSTDYDVNLIFTGSNLKVGTGEITETGTEVNTQTYILRTYPNTSVIKIDE